MSRAIIKTLSSLLSSKTPRNRNLSTSPNPSRHCRPRNPNISSIQNSNLNPSRPFSTSSTRWTEIIDLIRRDEAAMESDLNRKIPSPSTAAVTEILGALNSNDFIMPSNLYINLTIVSCHLTCYIQISKLLSAPYHQCLLFTLLELACRFHLLLSGGGHFPYKPDLVAKVVEEIYIDARVLC